ncbi:MAG: Sfum_1244 family protein [Pseudomonadota bacterium]
MNARLPNFNALVEAVQRNCHIADARHAREMTLCTYLLEMREFYRWEAGIAPGAPLERPEVGAWLNAREALWETLAAEDFGALPLAGATCEPFAVAAINRALVPHGLVYGAGIGRFGKPHFFLGRLDRQEAADGLTVLVCGCEYARDLTAMPAALQGGTVIVRREALRQWLWEKAEAWALKQAPGALALALAAHDYASDPRAALERMADAETETLILHERGEHAAGRLLGTGWEDRLACTRKRRAEILMRAVRDNLADSLVTLPALIEREAWPSLWFWCANLDGMRRELWPALANFPVEKVSAGGTAAELGALARNGAAHWESVARRLLALDETAVEALSRDIPALALA